MIDIHAHILNNLDDGPENLKGARRLVSLLHSEGVEMVIATPHLIPERYPEVTKSTVRRRIRELEGIIPIYEGYELHANYLPEDLDEYTLAGSNYILIEFSPFTPSSSIPLILRSIKNRGFIPIIAHTERYSLEIGTLKRFKKSGALLQFNAESIINMGTILYKLIKLEIIDFIASDIHPGRKAGLRDAYTIVKDYSEELANRLFYLNPYRVIKNQKIDGGLI